LLDMTTNNGLSKDVIAQTLTRRELEVFRLVSHGLANKVVARELGLTEGTVKIHLHSIYRKLRVANRAGLILSVMADRQQ
jgi:DNA-binding NarL/FixJ family response regulator